MRTDGQTDGQSELNSRSRSRRDTANAPSTDPNEIVKLCSGIDYVRTRFNGVGWLTEHADEPSGSCSADDQTSRPSG
jgi:hypothetical protein